MTDNSINPLLADIKSAPALPQVTMALPTRGAFYSENMFAPDVDPLDFPIGVMSILDENTYRDPFLFASGRAVPRLIKHVAPCLLYPEKLVEVDVEAILLASRLASYGPALNLSHVCQNPNEWKPDTNTINEIIQTGAPSPVSPTEPDRCRAKNDLNLNVQDFIQRYAPFTDEELAEYVLPMERIGQVVHLKPLGYENAIRLMMNMIQNNLLAQQLSEKSAQDLVSDEKLINDYTTVFNRSIAGDLDALVDSIHYVETASKLRVTNPEHIREWFNYVPIEEAKRITERTGTLNGALKKRSETKYHCSVCGYENTIYVQMDPQRLFSKAADSAPLSKSSAPSPITGKKGTTRSRISPR